MMTYICLERNGRRHYTREEVAKVIRDADPVEPALVNGISNSVDPGRVSYYLHLDEYGNILGGCWDGVEHFESTISISRFGITEEDFRKYGVNDYYEDHEYDDDDVDFDDDFDINEVDECGCYIHEEKIEMLNWWDSSFLDDHATLDCEAFAYVVDDLTYQINKYLDEHFEELEEAEREA